MAGIDQNMINQFTKRDKLGASITDHQIDSSRVSNTGPGNTQNLPQAPPPPANPPAQQQQQNNSTDESKTSWLLPAAAVLILGTKLLKSNKSKSISGMKFDKSMFKAVGKHLMHDTVDVGVLLGAAIASRKYLDLNLVIKDPDPNNKFIMGVIKWQGAIKLGVGIAIAAASNSVKNPTARNVMRMVGYGIAFDGGINTVRMLTQKDDGSNFIPALGANLLLDRGAAGTMGNNQLEVNAGSGTMGAYGPVNGTIGTAVGCPNYANAA